MNEETYQTLIVSPCSGSKHRLVLTSDGKELEIPADWDCLPPGDAAVTKVLKGLGPTWTVQVKKGRKTFSQGVWAPKENLEEAISGVEKKRSDPKYQKRLLADRQRREVKQEQYVEDFEAAVLQHLNFHSRYRELAQNMSRLITVHATPVGSGTVARTQRIPIEKRAAAAVTAWMRHETTAYDSMKIARIKGERRSVRAELAQASRQLLENYRQGREPEASCPLVKALAQ